MWIEEERSFTDFTLATSEEMENNFYKVLFIIFKGVSKEIDGIIMISEIG